MTHKLYFKGPVFTGDLNLDDAKMLSIPAKEHYNVVDLAFESSGMNAVMMTIQLPDLDYGNKRILGNEIADRWNAAPTLQKENDQLRALMHDLLTNEQDDVSLSSDLHARIKGALDSKVNPSHDNGNSSNTWTPEQ